jgi:hypothetical protein
MVVIYFELCKYFCVFLFDLHLVIEAIDICHSISGSTTSSLNISLIRYRKSIKNTYTLLQMCKKMRDLAWFV